eukprot:TRINITY_DN9150_c0_g2_i3.p1 TRINITY_DN9150_c0_g2~~TRINITY_DN9150_c0_g2_i3.p1  ORF type:complete len:765 (-),score=230.10 TRINITY_DN9150_c0_g2_i3:101-2395(-)
MMSAPADTLMDFNTDYLQPSKDTTAPNRNFMLMGEEENLLQHTHVQVLPDGSVIEDGSLSAEKVRELEKTHQAELQRLQLQLENERHMHKERQNNFDASKTVHIDTLSPQGQSIVIPSYAAWFDYDSIHGIEKRALPEFFVNKNKSKTPEIYFSYRNFMIDIYRLNPKEFLTVTACRRNLVGDVCAIMRVHGFLEMWGLINYQVGKDRKALQMGPSATNAYNILVDMPLGIQPLPPQKPQSEKETPVDVTKSLLIPTNSKVTQESDVLRKKQNPDVRPWTHTETERLLTSLEAYRDDWNKVSEMVGSRTQEECILHFLQLPIEDPFIESEKWPETIKSQPIPFSKQGNPVMSAIAFLASLVDNRIAKSAASAAIKEYNAIRNEPQVDEAAEKCKVANSEKSADTPTDEKTETEMDAIHSEETKVVRDELDGNEVGEEKQEDKMFGAEKSESSVDETKDIPTSSRAEEKDMSDGETIQIGGATALAVTSLKSRHLMQMEEKRIQQFVAHIVEWQMKKFQMKMNYFEELETILKQQRESQLIQREQLLQEKQSLYRERLAIQNKTGFPMTVCNVSQPHTQRVFTDTRPVSPPQPPLLAVPEQAIDNVKSDFDEITKALETEELSQQVSLDAEIKNMMEGDNEGSLYLQEGTSPMETSEFNQEHTGDLTNPSDFHLDTETVELPPTSLDPPTDHNLFDESTKDSPSIPFESDVSNLEPQDEPFVSMPQPFDETEGDINETIPPEIASNENAITENTVTEEPVANGND